MSTKNVVIWNGSKPENTTAKLIFDSFKEALTKKGCKTQAIQLSEVNIAPCHGCFHCWIKTPGECIYKDYGRETTKMFVQSDLIITITPVTFGGYSSILKKAIDRIIPSILPFFTQIKGETHHEARYEKHPRFLMIGILPRKHERKEEIFKKLFHRNALNMHSPSHKVKIVYEEGFMKNSADNVVTELLQKNGVIGCEE